jgi:hypothetical protein
VKPLVTRSRGTIKQHCKGLAQFHALYIVCWQRQAFS